MGSGRAAGVSARQASRAAGARPESRFASEYKPHPQVQYRQDHEEPDAEAIGENEEEIDFDAEDVADSIAKLREEFENLSFVYDDDAEDPDPEEDYDDDEHESDDAGGTGDQYESLGSEQEEEEEG